MPEPEITVLEALHSTPARRYLSPQPIGDDIVRKLLDAAIRGPNGGNDEFIELFNPCTSPVDLSNWALIYRSAMGVSDVTVAQLANGQRIAANGYLLIAGPAYVGSGAAAPDQVYNAGRLAAAGGGLELRDVVPAAVDSVGWGSATNAFVEGAVAPAPPAGQSIARTPNGSDSNHNDTDFAVATTPTPKASN